MPRKSAEPPAARESTDDRAPTCSTDRRPPDAIAWTGSVPVLAAIVHCSIVVMIRCLGPAPIDRLDPAVARPGM